MRSDASHETNVVDTGRTSRSKVNWLMIGELEGNKLAGYVPERNGVALGSSGVTIGMGVDLGQMDQQALDALDVAQSVKDKLKLYLGLKGAAAQAKLKSAPLELAQNDVQELNAAVQTRQIDELRRGYDQAVGASGAKFDDLPEEAQTVIASVKFQNGNIWASTHKNPNVAKLWKAATQRDWATMQSVLRNWTPKDYKTRRNKEADYLEPIVTRHTGQPAAPVGESAAGSLTV